MKVAPKLACPVSLSSNSAIVLTNSPSLRSQTERSFHSRRHLFGTFGKQIRHVADLVESDGKFSNTFAERASLTRK